MPTSPVGIIDSLASGFEIVARNLQILLLPLSIDLFLWLGPRFTFRPFMPGLEQFFTWYAESATGTEKDQIQQLIGQIHDLTTTAPAMYLPVILPPTLLGGRLASALPFDLNPAIFNTVGGNVFSILSALFFSVVLFEIFLGWIALFVLNEPFRLWQFTRQVASVTAQSFVVLGFGIIIFILSIFALMVASSIAYVLGSELLQWLFLVFYISIAMPIVIMTIFTLHSMYLNRHNVLAAIWDSVRVVNWNMLPTMTLLALIVTIYVGVNIICRMADQGSWLVLAGMGGNAFVSTGLMAATLVYYKDRYRYWRELREALLAEIERRRSQQDHNRQV